MEAVRKVVTSMNGSDLPVKKSDYIELVFLCVSFGAFVFEGQEFHQHRGLPMGSTLNAVMASLFMETLENKLIRIIGRGSHWFPYVDDLLVVVPERTNVVNKLPILNTVSENIKSTVELGDDRKLPFLYIIIHRDEKGVKFSVYKKPTSKDDFMHYLSQHSTRS
ncbi:uncharacterized protein LOC143037789 [Oratosquilla oratoria]|uniref:uncharacterized protein LOC143037789 n=1 Tax=Oratosquilla oratoria TaxID=337810 RepID=UPI003F77365B